MTLEVVERQWLCDYGTYQAVSRIWLTEEEARRALGRWNRQTIEESRRIGRRAAPNEGGMGPSSDAFTWRKQGG